MLFEVLLLPSRLILPVSIRFPQLIRRAAIARFYLVPLATTNTNKCSSNVVAIIYRVINCRCFSLIFFSMSLSVSLKKKSEKIVGCVAAVVYSLFLMLYFRISSQAKTPPTHRNTCTKQHMHASLNLLRGWYESPFK